MEIFSNTVVATLKNTMLYCPKCQETYEEAVGRFCPNDNVRLLTASSADKNTNQVGGVFSNVLNRLSSEEGEKFSSVPKFSQIEQQSLARPNFRPPTGNIFQDDPEFELELEPPPKNKSFISELAGQLKKSEETASEQSPVADAKAADISAYDQINPTFLPEQIIQNRYRVVELISHDESSSDYLATDISADKKVVVRVLSCDDMDDSCADKIFAEERTSLAQLNHPNIANIIESGKLPGGIPFIVNEYVQGETVANYLEKSGQFNALRTARVVRQTADALAAAHQIGVLHRGLKPENIVLTVDENGIERVKLINLGGAKEKLNEKNLLYKSPEQVEGKVANFTSDSYSLAVIAYQMLTNRLPFNAASVGDLLRAQREGLKLFASDLREDLPASVDKILKKALSFNPFDRFEKVQDFGDEFFGEIILNAPLEIDEEPVETNSVKQVDEPTFISSPPTVTKPANETTPIVADDYLPTIRETKPAARLIKATEALAWEKRSPEKPNEPTSRSTLFSILGAAAVLAALFAIWSYFINRPEPTIQMPVESVNQNITTAETSPMVETTATAENSETQPPRVVTQPPNTIFFQNSRENVKSDLAKNFLGFSLYFPKDWRRNAAPNNFLDISKTGAGGLPVEQMIVTYYNSKGTFEADTEIFPAQVKETNQSLKKILPNYRLISEGAKTVNNTWQAYEIQFQGTGKTSAGKAMTIWGKRLFIPTAVPEKKNGYVVTLLATSLSKEVKNVGDVGVKGELSSILETFEPDQNF